MSKINNNYFYYGADVITLRQKVKEWQGRFAEKSDATLDMSEYRSPIDIVSLTQSLQVQPLLSPKRLIIIRGASNESEAAQESIVNALAITSEATITLFVEENEGAIKSVIGQFVTFNGQIKHFPPLDVFKLRKLIEKRLNAAGATIKPDALGALCMRLAGDSKNFEYELQKLELVGKSVITLDIVDELVPVNLEFKPFALGEEILIGHPGRAWQIIASEIERGTAPMNLLGQLIANTRRIIAMRELQDQKVAPNSSPFFRAQKPYTITVAEKQAKRFKIEQLFEYYEKLVMADLRIKTGDDPLNVFTSLVRIG